MTDTLQRLPAAAAIDEGQTSETNDVPSATKRRRYVENLETITLDQHYDLTLIIDTPDHKDNQKAFRVSKSSMRHVSDVWTKMPTGEWAGSKSSEIVFPDDSWVSFRIILNIAHFELNELPDFMTFEHLQEPA